MSPIYLLLSVIICTVSNARRKLGSKHSKEARLKNPKESITDTHLFTSPNIVFILMDDLGYHDVSYKGGQFPTPHIDQLKAHSVELNKHYIHLMCSPSRTQFLTGRYAMNQGIGKMLPWDYTETGGIPVGQPTIADWLQASGYTTYAIGKWHCGYATEALLPTSKGFDHFFGFYQGAIHYDTLQYIDIKFGDSDHYDFWDDTTEYSVEKAVVDSGVNGEQLNSMHLYRDKMVEYIESESETDTPFYMYVPLQTIHGPLNRVHDYEAQCEEILGGNIARRSKYCQNMLLTDDVIGDIMNSLKQNNLWKDTIFVLTTDNGADIANKGCNYPLRGTKGTQFDGNTRVIALIGGGYIPTEQYGTERDALFSSLDWTPTLLHMAHVLHGIDEIDYAWDGFDQYNLIMHGENTVDRDHIVFNVGLRNLESATIVFKYVDGHLYKYIAQDLSVDQWAYKREDGWCVPDKNGDWDIMYNDDVSLAQDVDNKYLFDLTTDVSERTNLLQLKNKHNNYQRIIDFAKFELVKYTNSPLYSEHLPFLWTRLPAGDPSITGPGSFVAPFMTEDQYLEYLEGGFAKLKAQAPGTRKQDFIEPFSEELKTMYFEKWMVPEYLLSDGKEELYLFETGYDMVYGRMIGNVWYSYLIVGFVIGLLIVCGTRWTYWVKDDGYEPIKSGENI